MEPFAATDLLSTDSHCHFGLGLVTPVLLKLVIVGDDLPTTHDYNHYKYMYRSSNFVIEHFRRTDFPTVLYI